MTLRPVTSDGDLRYLLSEVTPEIVVFRCWHRGNLGELLHDHLQENFAMAWRPTLA